MTQNRDWSIFWALPHNEGMHVIWHKDESRIIFSPDEKTPGNSLLANLIIERLNSGGEIPEYHEAGDWIAEGPDSADTDDNTVLIRDFDGDVRVEILDGDSLDENLDLGRKVAMILNSADFTNLASLPIVRVPPSLPSPLRTKHSALRQG